jgi:hypothetical protein
LDSRREGWIGACVDHPQPFSEGRIPNSREAL